jgi:hypothetical protein
MKPNPMGLKYVCRYTVPSSNKTMTFCVVDRIGVYDYLDFRLFRFEESKKLSMKVKHEYPNNAPSLSLEKHLIFDTEDGLITLGKDTASWGIIRLEVLDPADFQFVDGDLIKKS